jgi:hypothetical protein
VLRTALPAAPADPEVVRALADRYGLVAVVTRLTRVLAAVAAGRPPRPAR